MNKKGDSAIGPIIKYGILAFLIIVIFFGGLPTIIKLFSFVNKIPAWALVVFGVILLFMIIGKKRR